jgi:hypothetical protein
VIAALRRGVPWPAALFVAACSGHSGPPAPQGWFVVQVADVPAAGGPAAGNCPFAPERFGAGTDQGGGVSATCRVQVDGDGFDVQATVSAGSEARLSITGTMSVTESRVHTTYVHGPTTLVSSTPCTVDFTGVPSGGVGGGRVEAEALCPQADDGNGHTCYVSAEFAFDNCER